MLGDYEAAIDLLAAAAANPPPTPSIENQADRERFLASQASFPSAPSTQHALRRMAELRLQETAANESSAAAETKANEQEAARLILQNQSLTFRHQFLLQYAKRLRKLALKKAPPKRGAAAAESHDAEEEEQQLSELQRRRMLFRGADETASVAEMVKALPPTWTVVQVSCVDQLSVTRFKETRRGEASQLGNPALCLLRLRYGANLYQHIGHK